MKLFSVYLVLLSLYMSSAYGNLCDENLDSELAYRQLQISKNESQLFRSNSEKFWEIVKDLIKHSTSPFTRVKGLVVGDAHLGNLSPYGIITNSGNKKSKMAVIDLDDAGVGLLAFDIAKLVVAVSFRLKDSDIKPEEIIQKITRSYVNGLNNLSFTPSKFLTKASDANSLYKLRKKQIKKKVDKNKSNEYYLKEKQNELIEVPSQARYEMIKQAMEHQYSEYKVLDIKLRQKERGGSANENTTNNPFAFERYWVLAAKNSSKSIELEIFDVKEAIDPGVHQLGLEQFESTKSRIDSIKQFFFQTPEYTNSQKSFELNSATIENNLYIESKTFKVRPKHWIPDALEFPSRIKNSKEAARALELAIYQAHFIGQLHGRQTGNIFVNGLNLNLSGGKELMDLIDGLGIELFESFIRDQSQIVSQRFSEAFNKSKDEID